MDSGTCTLPLGLLKGDMINGRSVDRVTKIMCVDAPSRPSSRVLITFTDGSDVKVGWLQHIWVCRVLQTS